MKASIESFGYVEPIIWNERTGNMVGGHQRYKIMTNDLEHKELAVSVVNLDDQQEKLLNIALNKISGDWDEGALTKLLDDMQQDGVDISLSGFDDVDLKRMLGDIEIPNFEAGTAEDQGDLGVLSSKLVTCPHCGEEFEHD
ncbi:transcriptional regulator [Paenibacillus polymyxa]|nr:transcriptional regulator [Paenibacillus polymyxa]MDY8022967.1 transcriptional regulator [Paenibacillus polymyxa]